MNRAEAIRRNLLALARAAPPAYEIVPSASGLPTAKAGGRFLHSSRDPRREARRRAAEAKPERPPRAVVVLGLGLGYLLEAAAERFPDALLLGVASSRGALRSALEARPDLAAMADSGAAVLLSAEDAEYDLLAEFLDEDRGMEVLVLSDPAVLAESPEAFRKVAEAVGKIRLLHRRSFLTSASFAEEWTRRLFENAEAVAEAEDVGALLASAAGGPIAVAGAGPGLEAARAALPPGAGRRTFAVDTAYPVFLGGDGREPEPPAAVFTADSQDATRRHFEGLSAGTTILVASPIVPRAIFELPFAAKYVFALPGGAFAWFQERLGIRTPLRAGGSILASAFDAARKAGGNPILLLGADFAYGSRRYARGTAYDRDAVANLSRFSSLEGALRSRSTKKIARGGRVVETDDALLSYAAWFEEEIANARAEGTAVRAFAPSPLLSVAEADPADLAALAKAPPIAPGPRGRAARDRIDPKAVRREAARHLLSLAEDLARAARGAPVEILRPHREGPGGLLADAVLRAPLSEEERRALAGRLAEAARRIAEGA